MSVRLRDASRMCEPPSRAMRHLPPSSAQIGRTGGARRALWRGTRACVSAPLHRKQVGVRPGSSTGDMAAATVSGRCSLSPSGMPRPECSGSSPAAPGRDPRPLKCADTTRKQVCADSPVDFAGTGSASTDGHRPRTPTQLNTSTTHVSAAYRQTPRTPAPHGRT